MKFTINRASGKYGAPIKGSVLEKSYKDIPGWEKVGDRNIYFNKETGFYGDEDRRRYEIEINTLEDILKLIEEEDSDIIIGKDRIVIYDGYIE